MSVFTPISSAEGVHNISNQLSIGSDIRQNTLSSGPMPGPRAGGTGRAPLTLPRSSPLEPAACAHGGVGPPVGRELLQQQQGQ